MSAKFTHRVGQGVGAGGWVTGISIAADGTKMVRTDTFNAYSMWPGAAGQWELALKPGINCDPGDTDIFYGGDPHPWGQTGTFDVAIAPSDSKTRYVVCMGYVWVTKNGGAWWDRCALPQKEKCFPNAACRMTGRPLAVDPRNPAVVFFGAPDGLHYSTDYGLGSWTSV